MADPRLLIAVVLVAVAAPLTRVAALPADGTDPDDLYALPEGLLIGAGVSALQTEGSWNKGGKSESAADHVLHTGKLAILNFGDAHEQDNAADSYNRYKEDVAMAAKLKLKLYRFSFSWSRLLPEADASKPNAEGVKFYHNFIDEILKHNMTPLATLYHFDHPQILEDQFKGWQGHEMVAKFEEYAKFVFSEYSSKVKMWSTINEPNMYCFYFSTLYFVAGLYKLEDMDHYKCFRNMVLGHAKAYRAFQDGKYKGQVGFTALLMPTRPNSTLPEDAYAAEAFNQMMAGIVLHPVVHGDYPQLAKDLAGRKLYQFSDEEKQLVKGTTDYIGFNVYSGLQASWKDPNSTTPQNITLLTQMMEDLPFVVLETSTVKKGDSVKDMFTMVIDPDAIRTALLWMWQNYKLPLMVNENGLGDIINMGKKDMIRAAYHSAFLRTLVKTVKEFRINVIGYCAWSLIDSFEWSGGYERTFGLVHVDYANKTLNRSLKESSEFWIKMADTGVVPYVKDPRSSSPPSTTASWLLLVSGILVTIAGLKR